MIIKQDSKLSIEQEELRGVSRTVAEIEWLLLILVLIYQSYSNDDQQGKLAISMALFFYAAFIMSFRYANFYREESRWKIAIETCGMLLFITWSLWFTGGDQSPLINTYLLVIITSALTLGKYITLGFLIAIGSCLYFLGSQSSLQEFYSMNYASATLSKFAPFVLVAYITTMFSSDIRYGLNKAKLMSETDELTGILNRRGFAIVADRLFGQALRYKRPLSILVIDSDNLKQVNDSFGHKAGDDLLTQLVKSIQPQLRDTDIFARQGGDEFLVLLTETLESGAFDVAERICKSVSNKPLGFGNKAIHLSVSIGVASFPDNGYSLDALITNGDKALYAAKKNGKNKAFKFSDLTE